VFADGVAFEACGVPVVGVFADVDVEVIEPEVGHDLLELALAEDGAEDLGFGEFADDCFGGADVRSHTGEDLAFARAEVGEEEIFLVAGDVGGEGDAVGDGELDEDGHSLIFGEGEELACDAGGGFLVGFLLGGGFGVGGWGEIGFAVGVELVEVPIFVEFRDLDFVHGDEEGVVGVGAAAFGDLFDGEAVGEELEGLLGLEVEGGVVGQAVVEGGVGDAGGVELLLEPLFGGHGEEFLEVAGAWAEGEAVEELLGSFLLGERGGFCGAWRLGLCGFGDGSGLGMGCGGDR